jgi:hypothetical protein
MYSSAPITTSTTSNAPWYVNSWYLNAIKPPKPACMSHHAPPRSYMPGFDAYTEQLCKRCYCKQFGGVRGTRPITAITLWNSSYDRYDNYTIYDICYDGAMCNASFSMHRIAAINDPNGDDEWYNTNSSFVQLWVHNIPSRVHDMTSEISFLIEVIWVVRRIYKVRLYAADATSLGHIEADNIDIVLNAGYDPTYYDHIEYVATDGTKKKITIDDVIFAIGPKSEILHEI